MQDRRLVDVRLADIRPNPDQPRRRFDADALQELADSIGQHGILQPLVVQAEDDGTFSLVAGERRLRAAALAGLDTVPVVVRDDLDVELAAISENVARRDLNPIEEARAFSGLLRRMTVDEIARSVGRSIGYVKTRLELLALEIPIQPLVADGTLGIGQAIAIARLGASEQLSMAAMTMSAGLTPQAIGAWVTQEQTTAFEVYEVGEARQVRNRYEVVIGSAIQAVNAMLDRRTLELLPAALEGDVPMELERLRLLGRAVTRLHAEIEASVARSKRRDQ